MQSHNSFKCDICSETFNKSHDLRSHKQTQHREQIPCQLCDKTFKNNKNAKNPYYRNVVQNFENKWHHLQQKFGITAPPKVHIICEHIHEYIESKGIALGRTSDQLI